MARLRQPRRVQHSRAPAAPRKSSTLVTVDNHQLKLSNLDKILYRTPGFTKGQVIDYYARIAPVILPYLKGRPLTLKRYPDGVDAAFFYEKMCPSHRPDWVTTIKVASTNQRKYIEYCLVEEPATLIWVANLAAIELHTLLSTRQDLTRPTYMVFDHDPGPGATLLDCIRVALRFRDLLKDLGLKQSFPKTSGGKGLHLYVPLHGAATFDQTKFLARATAQLLERDDPRHITSNMRKDLRIGKVFVDWSQNDDHKTTVTAYSLRARDLPTVSTPVTWEELEHVLKRKAPEQLVFTSDAVLKRVEKLGDVFAPVLSVRQSLPAM